MTPIRTISAAFALLLAACAPETLEHYGIDEAYLDEQHELAIETLDALQPISIENNLEYCGDIGLDLEDNLVATPAVAGDAVSCLAADPPEDLYVTASYHTHAAFDPEHESEVPSVDDMLGDIEEQIDGYVGTPGGRVWFIDGEAETAEALCTVLCITADPDHDDDVYGIIPEAFTRAGLEAWFEG